MEPASWSYPVSADDCSASETRGGQYRVAVDAEPDEGNEQDDHRRPSDHFDSCLSFVPSSHVDIVVFIEPNVNKLLRLFTRKAANRGADIFQMSPKTQKHPKNPKTEKDHQMDAHPLKPTN